MTRHAFSNSHIGSAIDRLLRADGWKVDISLNHQGDTIIKTNASSQQVREAASKAHQEYATKMPMFD